MSQENLAELADLHRTYITDIERGARNLSLETMSRLATALGLTVGTLFSQIENTGGFGEQSSSLVSVLLVEDDARDIDLTLAAFKSAGMTNNVFVVRDGLAALDFIFCRRQYANRRIENCPQVILLDLKLPKMHGLEVLRHIKSDSQTRHLRVVVLSSSQDDIDIQKAIELGAETYITKPVDFLNFSKVTPKLSLRWALLGSQPRTSA